MKELIKQLLIQSEVFNKDGTVLKDVCGYELNKFAEFIVRECAGVGYDASYYECALNVSDKIKQHFGVEE